jgi:hypothetical protein
MQQRTGRSKPKNRQTGAKIAITALSISLTLGAWQALAGQEAKAANLQLAAGQPAQVSQETAPLPAALPTLIAPLPGRNASGSAELSSSQRSGTLFLGGSKPQTVRPAPVARTGSSR